MTARLSGAAKRRLLIPRPRSGPAELREAVDGRLVLITGASHGIGAATAQMVAAAGATVVMVARSGDRLRDLAGEFGDRAHALPCDLADEDAVDALAETVLTHHGTPDIVVSNAGRSIRRPLAESYDRFHDVSRTTAINYHGPVGLLLGLLPTMRARGSGHIVNVSTVGARLAPAPRWAAYVASKRAFDAWLRSAAAESARDGVTATSIYFGLVHTRMSAPSTDFSNVPGMTPQDAARLIGDAIVRRPAAIAPWWATAAGAMSEAAPGAMAAVMRRYGASRPDDREPSP